MLDNAKLTRGRLVVVLVLLVFFASAGPAGVIMWYAELVGLALYVALGGFASMVVLFALEHLWKVGI